MPIKYPKNPTPPPVLVSLDGTAEFRTNEYGEEQSRWVAVPPRPWTNTTNEVLEAARSIGTPVHTSFSDRTAYNMAWHKWMQESGL